MPQTNSSELKIELGSKALNDLKPIVRDKALKLIDACQKAGHPITITCTYRSAAEQDVLYAEGRTKPGSVVTNARSGQSFHQYHVAFDVAIIDKYGNINWNADLSPVGRLGQNLGLEWGGSWQGFKDISHFQYLAGYALSDFQDGRVDESKFALPVQAPVIIPPVPSSLATAADRQELTTEEVNYFSAIIKWIAEAVAKLALGYNKPIGGVTKIKMSNRRFGALSSSTDPEKLAAWVTGAIISFSSVIMWGLSHYLGLSVTSEQVAQSAAQIGTAIGSIWFLFGLVRKTVVAVHDKVKPQG